MFINVLFFFFFCLFQIKYISTIDANNDVAIEISAFDENKNVRFLNVTFKDAIFAFLVSKDIEEAKDILVFQSMNGGKSWKKNDEVIRSPCGEMSVVHYIFVEENEIVLIFVSNEQTFITKSENGSKWEIPQKINENFFDNKMGYYSGKAVEIAKNKKPVIFMCIDNNTYVKDDIVSDGECAFSYDKGNTWIRNSYFFVKNNIGKINYENPFVYNGFFFFSIHLFSKDRYSYVMCNKYEEEQNFYCDEAPFTAPGYEISHVIAMKDYLYAILSNETEKKIGISKDGVHFYNFGEVPEGKEYNFILINDSYFLLVLSNNRYTNVMLENEAFSNHSKNMTVPFGDYKKKFSSLNDNPRSKTKNIYIDVNKIITFSRKCSYKFGKNYSKMQFPKGSYLLSENEFAVKVKVSNYIPLSNTVNITRVCGSQIEDNIKLHYQAGGSLKFYVGVDFTYSSYNYKIIETNVSENKVFNIPVYVHESEIILGLICPVDNMSDMMCFEKVYNTTSQNGVVSETYDTTNSNLVPAETLFGKKKITIKPKRKLINSLVNAIESLLVIDEQTASSIYTEKQNISFRCECMVKGYKVEVNYLLQPHRKGTNVEETNVIEWKARLDKEKNEKNESLISYHTSNNDSYSNFIRINIYVICFNFFLIYMATA